MSAARLFAALAILTEFLVALLLASAFINRWVSLEALVSVCLLMVFIGAVYFHLAYLIWGLYERIEELEGRE